MRDALGGEYDPVLRPSDQPGVDVQANGAMAVAKQLGRPPREIAQAIVDAFDGDGVTTEVEVAGPGFINVTVSDAFLASLLHGSLDVPHGARQTVVVDYSQPNVAKEMHVGHLRSTVIGDSIARTLGFLGHDVIRQNHVGDWGTNFGMLIEHMLDRGETEAAEELSLGELEAFYREANAKFQSDDAFKERARARVVALQSGDPETLRLWHLLIDESEQYFSKVYERLDVLLTEDDIAGESFYNPMLADVARELEGSGLAVIDGGALCVFPPGFTGRDGKPFPLMVRKSDGGYGYDATDLAALRYRVNELKGDRIVYVVDARQSQHFALLFAAGELAGWLNRGHTAEHVSFGSVLGADGKPLKTRAGDNVKLIELLDEAVTAGRGGRRREEPGPRRSHAGRGRPHGRHWCDQVRRPLQRPGQGLRLRLRPNAFVRRQHRAVPPVRARADQVDLPPRRGGRGLDRRRDPGRTGRTRPGRGAARVRARGARRLGDASSRTGSPPTCSTWPRRSPRSTRPARSCGPTTRRRGDRDSRWPTSRRGRWRWASACSASTRRTRCSGCAPL